MGNIPSEPTPGDGFLVLWVGGATAPEQAVQRMLRSAGVRIESTDVRTLVDDTNARAPDLILLGDSALPAETLLARLREVHPGCLVPVVTLASRVASAPKLNARFGEVSRLDSDLPADDLAPKLLKLLRGLSRRPPRWRLEVELGKLPALIKEYRDEGREGLFSTPAIGALALGAHGLLSAPTELLVGGLDRSVDPNITFYERPPGAVRVVDTLPVRATGVTDLRGARVLVIDERVGRAGAIASALENAGAEARVVLPDEERIKTNRSLDPTVICVRGTALLDPACRPLLHETRLSSATLLVLGPNVDEQTRPDPLLAKFGEAAFHELSLTRRLQGGEGLAERLETLGAARWLKVVGRCAHDVTLHVFAVTGRAQVTLRGGKIETASFQPADPRAARITGRPAIQSLLGLPFGRVLAGPIERLRDLELASVVDLSRLARGGRAVLQTDAAPDPGLQTGRQSGRPPADPRASTQGLVAREVVVHHPAAPSKSADVATKPPPAITDHRVPIEEDDGAEQTASYKLGTLERKLREALRSEPDSPTVPEPGTGVPTKPVLPDVPRAARPFGLAAKRPLSDVPDEDLLETAMPETSAARVARPRARPNLWFVAAVMLALATGAWAAWRLGVDPETNSARAGTEPHVEPITPVAVDRPDAGPPRRAIVPHESRSLDELLQASEEAARNRDFERSEILARQALDRDPHSARAMYRIAAALLRQRRHQEALSFAERAREAAPRDPAILVLKAHILVRVGRVPEAIEAYEACLELSPGFAPAQQQLDRLRRGDAPSDPITEPPEAPPETPPETPETPPETPETPPETPEVEVPPTPPTPPDPPRQVPTERRPTNGTPANPYH